MKEIDIENIDEAYTALLKEKEVSLIDTKGVYKQNLTITDREPNLLKMQKIVKGNKYKKIILRLS